MTTAPPAVRHALGWPNIAYRAIKARLDNVELDAREDRSVAT